MIKIIQSYQVKASVIAIYSDESTIYFTDCNQTIYTVCKTTWNLSSELLMPQPKSALHRFQKGACFSKGGHIAYSAQEQGSCALSLKLSHVKSQLNKSEQPQENDEKTLLEESVLFYGNDQAAEVISFCGDDGEYFFSGGTDGRIFMHCSDSGKLLMSLKPKPEYISSISTDCKGDFVAYGAFDNSLTILNLRYQKEILNTVLSDVIEHSFFYNDSKSFYGVGRDGNSYTYDLKTDTFSKKALFPVWPNCCVVDSSQRFAIIGARNEKIYIVKLSDNSLFSSFKLDQKGIASLHLEGSYLFVGFENGWLYMIDMFAYVEDFSQSIAIKDFKNAKKYLDKNLFLSIHPISEMFQEAWEDALKEIVCQFSTGNSALAFEFAEPFLSDENYKKEFALLLKRQKEFENFLTLVEKKEYFEAYGMLERAPYLSQTQSAHKLEQHFLKIFSEAKKLISQDALRNFAKAQEILKPFTLIPTKKEAVYLLLKNHEVYLRADSFIKEKRFKDYFALTAKYDFLTAQEMHKRVCSLAESSILKIKKLVDMSRYEDALNGLKQLVVFTPYKEEILQVVKEIKIRQKLSELISTDNIEQIYSFVAIYPQLESVKEFLDYDAIFNKVLHEVMILVSEGEVKAVRNLLAPYKDVTVFKPKIKECLRQATLNKLRFCLQYGSLQEAKIVALHYLKEFSKDKNYDALLKQYKLEL